MEPRIQYAQTTDGVNIAFWTLGEGPALVQMGSPPFSHIQLEWQFPEARMSYERLAKKRQLVRFDWRGSGLSDRSITDFSADAHVRDLEAVADKAGLERMALMAAVDAGPIAVMYAARHPERVSDLALLATYATGGFEDQTEVMALYELMDRDWRLFCQTLVHSMVGWSGGDFGRQWSEVIMQATSPEAVHAVWSMSFGFDVSALLPQVQARTLVVYPSQVSWVNPDESKRLASGIPDARLVVLDDVAGIVWWEESNLLRIIEEFLDEGRVKTTAPELPSGTAVILFADIADSTALTERIGDQAFRNKARGLDGALRAIIQDAAGTAVEGKLLGDGVLAVFSSARQAIEAALRCGQSGDEAELPLHLGVHAGDVIREEGNVFGGAVNIAARISALSAPGEVLVSETVRSLARTSAGVGFEDRGEHELKGVSEPVRMYEVRWREEG